MAGNSRVISKRCMYGDITQERVCGRVLLVMNVRYDRGCVHAIIIDHE